MMQTLYSIQYLRGFAALAVVVFHAGERTGMPFTIGAAGVDVFFVVSGFIMMAISDARPTSPVAFLRNRILRVAPAYWAATLLMIIGAATGLFPNLKLEFAHMLGSFLFLPVASPSTGDLWPVLVQGWTLNYEIFFYAVFALVLLLKPGLRLAALTAILGLLVAGGSLLQTENPVVDFYTSPVILEFAAGAALAKLWQADRLPSPATGALLIVLSLSGFAAIQLFRLEFDAWSCGPLAFLLVMGALAVEISGKLPVSRTLAYLGDSSYSIYLWHTFAISVMVKLGTMLSLTPFLTVTIAIILGIAAGVAGYEFLEKPVQNLIKRHRHGSRHLLQRRPAS